MNDVTRLFDPLTAKFQYLAFFVDLTVTLFMNEPYVEIIFIGAIANVFTFAAHLAMVTFLIWAFL